MTQPSPTNLNDELTAALLDLSNKFNCYATRLSPEHNLILNAKAAITAAYAEAIRECVPEKRDWFAYPDTQEATERDSYNAATETLLKNLKEHGLIR